jgi:hypothetical protein
VLVVSLNEGTISWDVRCVISILAMGITMEKEDFFCSVIIADIIGASLAYPKFNIHAWRNNWLCYVLKIGTNIFYWVANLKSGIRTSLCVEISSFFTKFAGSSHFIMGDYFLFRYSIFIIIDGKIESSFYVFQR